MKYVCDVWRRAWFFALQMMTLVIIALAVFDFVLEHLEEYLHHYKSRFHQRLFHKVRASTVNTYFFMSVCRSG